jgi:hypothetical protein
MTAAITLQRCTEARQGPLGDHTFVVEIGWT